MLKVKLEKITNNKKRAVSLSLESTARAPNFHPLILSTSAHAPLCLWEWQISREYPTYFIYQVTGAGSE